MSGESLRQQRSHAIGFFLTEVPLEGRDGIVRASGPDHTIRRLVRSKMRFEPAGEPQIRYPGRMVGVVVGHKLDVDAPDGQLELVEPDGGTTPGVANLRSLGLKHRIFAS